jgi:hypothetical protein
MMAEIVTIINLFYFAGYVFRLNAFARSYIIFGVLSLWQVLWRHAAYNEGSKQINAAAK